MQKGMLSIVLGKRIDRFFLIFTRKKLSEGKKEKRKAITLKILKNWFQWLYEWQTTIWGNVDRVKYFCVRNKMQNHSERMD